MALTNAEKQAAHRARIKQTVEELTIDNDKLREELDKAKKKIAALERKVAKLTTK